MEKVTKNTENRTVLPLVGSTFEPGKMQDAIAQIEDASLREIATAEAYYFSAQAQECVSIVKKYLKSEDLMLHLSADMLYVFGNLTLGNAVEAQMAREDVARCLKQSRESDYTEETKAFCVFAYYLIYIFLHIAPDKELPPLEQAIPKLPVGQRLFAVSLLAHGMYLQGEYAKAQGVVETAMLMSRQVYPISFIYLFILCGCHVPDQSERSGGRNSIHHEGMETGQRRPAVGAFY